MSIFGLLTYNACVYMLWAVHLQSCKACAEICQILSGPGKKYRSRYRKKLVPEKSTGPGTGKNSGYRHTLIGMCAQVQGPIQPAPVVPCDGKALDRCV